MKFNVDCATCDDGIILSAPVTPPWVLAATILAKRNGSREYTYADLWTASMDMPAKIEFLMSAIARQQTTLRLQTALAAMLFVLGITVVILSFVNPGLILAETLKTGQTLGGTVVAASGFILIFFSRRDKIVALRSLLLSYQHQQVGGLSPDAKLDQYFDQYFAMVLGRLG
jgi:hypothetical protein